MASSLVAVKEEQIRVEVSIRSHHRPKHAALTLQRITALVPTATVTLRTLQPEEYRQYIQVTFPGLEQTVSAGSKGAAFLDSAIMV